MTDAQLFGTLSVLEFFMLVVNMGGLVLAVAAAGEAQMDYESIRILGRRGLIAGADVRQRLLKATGSRRDEGLKVLVHAALLAIGIIIAASPASRTEYYSFAAFWTVSGIILVGVVLSVGSIFTLIDRRKLWAMFDTEDGIEAQLQHQEGEHKTHENDYADEPAEDVEVLHVVERRSGAELS